MEYIWDDFHYYESRIRIRTFSKVGSGSGHKSSESATLFATKVAGHKSSESATLFATKVVSKKEQDIWDVFPFYAKKLVILE
jgi:hypothetical protein